MENTIKEIKHHTHAHVELCTECRGGGFVYRDLPMSNDRTAAQCPQCLGSGRVRVWGTTTTYVEAYQGRLPFHLEVVVGPKKE